MISDKFKPYSYGIVALHDSTNSGGCGSERFTEEVILQEDRFDKLESVSTLTLIKRSQK